MRTYTLILSIAAHVGAACALLFTTVLATDELPAPHEASTFVNVIAVVPAAVPPPPKPRPAEAASPAALTPLTAPEGIHAETAPAAPDGLLEPFHDGVVGGFGADAGVESLAEPLPPPRRRPSNQSALAAWSNRPARLRR